ncbi:MAG: hypothetical protein KBD15_00690 [Candidatus Magasanikbacteria bacterium]|jgi:hypothetical protein|nr:hypothetical protein [Candidatus Magasanikbacteria bacterium]
MNERNIQWKESVVNPASLRYLPAGRQEAEPDEVGLTKVVFFRIMKLEYLYFL